MFTPANTASSTTPIPTAKPRNTFQPLVGCCSKAGVGARFLGPGDDSAYTLRFWLTCRRARGASSTSRAGAFRQRPSGCFDDCHISPKALGLSTSSA